MGAQWTVLVYLAGDNNLELFGQRDLAEMKAVGSTDAVHLLAQFDRMSDGVTRRYRLTADHPLAADEIATLPESNTGDPRALLNFIAWGLDEYPAERTALVLWNHGAGWKDDDIYALASPGDGLAGRPIARSLFLTSVTRTLEYPAADRAILFDDTSRDFLDNRELKTVLDEVLARRSGRKLDLIGFDACLMNMVEVAAQVEHACEQMVGSQEIEPGAGWPYTGFLARLTAAPLATPMAAGRMLVEAYADHYTAVPPGIGVTQSAIRLGGLPPLIDAVGRLADALLAGLTDPAFFGRVLLPALRGVQKLSDWQCADLCHLAHLLAGRTSDPALWDPAREVEQRLRSRADDAVITASWAAGATVEHAQGISIYLPLGSVSPAYRQLEFARRCSWVSFLDTYARS
jgi:cysteine peptidase C11 family protein